MNNTAPPIIPKVRTWYAVFPFGTRHRIGLDDLAMWERWVEVKSHDRKRAIKLLTERFGPNGWHLHSDEQFDSRAKYYPAGCCLIIQDWDS